jgi:hypothetical protein
MARTPRARGLQARNSSSCAHPSGLVRTLAATRGPLTPSAGLMDPYGAEGGGTLRHAKRHRDRERR